MFVKQLIRFRFVYQTIFIKRVISYLFLMIVFIRQLVIF